MKARLACLALAASLLSPLAHAEGAADTAAARELFREGSRLAKEGRWAEARARFERSLALKRAPVTLYSLGVAQKSSGLLVEALETLRAFLVEPKTASSEAYQQPAKDAIEELERKVGRLRVDVEPRPPSLTVTVDGAEILAAALDTRRLVNPGEHDVEARAPGFETARVHVVVAEGNETHAKLPMKALAPVVVAPPPSESTAPAAAPITPPPPAASPPSRALPVTLLVTGGALVVGGVVVGMLGVSQAKSADTKNGSDADSARTKALVGDILGGVGLVTAAVGGYVLWSTPSGSEQPAARVVWTGNGVALTGHLGR